MKTLTKELWMQVPERRAIMSIHDEVERLVEESGVNTDSAALKQNKISITPVHYNLTCFKALEAVSSLEMPSLESVRKRTEGTV